MSRTAVSETHINNVGSASPSVSRMGNVSSASAGSKNAYNYDSYDYLCKLLVIGDSGCGKSSLLKRFSDDEFCLSYSSTIGVDFEVRSVDVLTKRGQTKTVKMQMWDTAGQERFRTITSSYYRGAHAVLVVFDVTVEESFQNVRKWLAELDAVNNAHSAHAPGSRGNGSGGLGSGSSFARHTQVLLVANKTDLTRARVVESHRIAAFADELGLPFVESSAKSNVNVSEAFHTIAQSFVERRLEDERAGWVEVGGPGGKKDVQNKHLRVSGTSVDDEEGSSWRKCFGACAIM